jgi:hypothetical protein
MSKTELRELVSKAVREEVKFLERRMAARESQMDEAIDMAHQHEVRIAALEDRIDKAMREMGAPRASINSPTPSSSSSSSSTTDNLPVTPLAPSPPSEHSSKAPSYPEDSSDDDSIYGVEDHMSEPRVSSSPDQAPEVNSPQLDSALEDELAELGGLGLDTDASEDDSDGNITDQDAEGETDDEYEAPEPPIPSTGSEILAGRMPIRPLSKCKTKGASTPRLG